MKKIPKIQRQVEGDLEHIPRGPRGSTQNYFRQMYSAMRINHLSKTSKTKEETFLEVWEHWKKIDVNFVPIYDPSYFKI